MELPELLEELVGDNGAVNQRIQQLAGLESATHRSEVQPSATPTIAPVSTPAPAASSSPAPQNSTVADSADAQGLSSIEW